MAEARGRESAQLLYLTIALKLQ